LRGETALRVREDRKTPAAARKKRAASSEIAPQDEPLWEALRECRKELAAEQNVPPYVIFHDATLREMVAMRPGDAEQLLAVGGVGQAKLARYGERFLEVLRRHAAPAV
jgi:ATP-dependent DNA helicase RecQ